MSKLPICVDGNPLATALAEKWNMDRGDISHRSNVAGKQKKPANWRVQTGNNETIETPKPHSYGIRHYLKA